MNALKSANIDCANNISVTPALNENTRNSFLNLNDSITLSNTFSYTKEEIRLMKQVKEIINNRNTIELVAQRLHTRDLYRKYRKLDQIDIKELKFGVMSIHSNDPKIDFSDKEFEILLQQKYENLRKSKFEKKSENKVELSNIEIDDISKSVSPIKFNETNSDQNINGSRKSVRANPFYEHEVENTEDSEEITQSSACSFRYQLSNPISLKHKLKNKKHLKLTSKNINSAKNFFRHKVRIVIALLKLVDFAYEKFQRNFIKIKQEHKMEDITELVKDTFSTPTDSDKVVFNKDYYKAKKETDLNREIQYALTAPPDFRTNEQIKLARNSLLKMESFAEYPVNMQEKICRCAFYQKMPPKRVIIRQGQVADSFYFIISGQAMVTVLDEDKKTGEIKNRILAVLRDGTCFGELAFLYNTTRTATVTSLTPMELLSIGRDDFYDIFMSNRGQEPEHIQFLRKCEFIKHWPIQVLLQNPTSCVFHYYKRNQVIVADSSKSEYIFIIKSGTCQVLKKLDSVKPKKLLRARPTMSKENFLTDTYRSKIDCGRKKENYGHDGKQANIPWSFTHLEEPSKEKVEPVFLQIQLLKAGDTFGLNLLKFDETDVNLPNPELSLISNGSEVLMLKKDIFLRHSNEKVKENIRQMLQPFSSTKDMQRKFQTAADWKYFKSKHMKEVYSNLKKNSQSSSNVKI